MGPLSPTPLRWAPDAAHCLLSSDCPFNKSKDMSNVDLGSEDHQDLLETEPHDVNADLHTKGPRYLYLENPFWCGLRQLFRKINFTSEQFREPPMEFPRVHPVLPV